MTVKEWLTQYPTLEAKYYLDCTDATKKEETDQLRKQLAAIHEAIDAIDDPKYRIVLTLRYTEGNAGRLMPWRDVAFAMYHNDAEADLMRVHRLHRKALDMVKLPNG
ncbi:MAG: hypothetical protein E7437_05385 [Ruminococcaceae bacterium]|nr:hypothetical protein [Oscillospiraceae bacterium]